jgi:hypothetical protein
MLLLKSEILCTSVEMTTPRRHGNQGRHGLILCVLVGPHRRVQTGSYAVDDLRSSWNLLASTMFLPEIASAAPTADS